MGRATGPPARRWQMSGAPANVEEPCGEAGRLDRTADFRKDPARWAATPVHRYRLHLELNGKLQQIAAWGPTAPRRLNPCAAGKRGIITYDEAAVLWPSSEP